MAYPATQSRGDTRLLAWRKVLGQLQNQPGALAANNPNKNDGLRRVLVKVLNALLRRSGEGQSSRPFLVANASNQLTWSVAGVTPAFAVVGASIDHGASWSIIDTVAWTTVLYQVQAGDLYRIQGVDGSGNAVTAFSNIVSL